MMVVVEKYLDCLPVVNGAGEYRAVVRYRAYKGNSWGTAYKTRERRFRLPSEGRDWLDEFQIGDEE